MPTKKRWSAKVKTRWKPPAGFFTLPADRVAVGLARYSESYRQAMARLTLYVNRAGSNLSVADRKRLERAKVVLRQLYGD